MAERAPAFSADDDRRFMGAAIRLGRRHLGRTAPNPSVGALVVAGEGASARIAGQGITAPSGRPHAEPQALAMAGAAARGSTVYVSLEPCAHFGRTPPCANALIEAGVARVVYALDDPDSRVAGKGRAMLEAAGIAVTSGVLAAEAREAHRGHISRVVRGRPFVTLKLAVSRDGCIGLAGTGQVAITGSEARRAVQALRIEADAIAVGQGTADADDPQLTVRLDGLASFSPLRVVFSGGAPLAGHLAETGAETLRVLAEGRGGRDGDVIVPANAEGRPSIPAALGALAARGISSLLVEGGARLARAFLDADAVDEILLFQGTTTLGADGVRAFGTDGPDYISRLGRFARLEDVSYGADRMTRYLKR